MSATPQQVIDQMFRYYENNLVMPMAGYLKMACTVAYIDECMCMITYDGKHGETVNWNLDTGEVSTL